MFAQLSVSLVAFAQSQDMPLLLSPGNTTHSTRLSIRMLSISANVLVLSHRFQRFAVRVVQAEPVAVVCVDGDVDAPIVPVDGAFDVG